MSSLASGLLFSPAFTLFLGPEKKRSSGIPRIPAGEQVALPYFACEVTPFWECQAPDWYLRGYDSHSTHAHPRSAASGYPHQGHYYMVPDHPSVAPANQNPLTDNLCAKDRLSSL